MSSVLAFVVDLLATIFLTSWAVRRDMRNLPPERYARGWNAASFWSAVVGFGPLCIPVHFIRTRRTVLGGLVGLLWAAGVLVASSALSSVVEAAVSLVK